MIAQNSTKIFIAYTRQDEKYLNKLKKHLEPLNRKKDIQIWYDGEIMPGMAWEKIINDNLEKADFILLLVSANSLASDYFHDKEMTKALAKHENKSAFVMPIILEHCAWKLTELKKLYALPKNGTPIVEWNIPSKAYYSIVQTLQKNIKLKKSGEQIEDWHQMEVIDMTPLGVIILLFLAFCLFISV